MRHQAGEVGGRRDELRRNAEASMGPSMCMVAGDASGEASRRPQDSRFGAQWEDEDWDRGAVNRLGGQMRQSQKEEGGTG